MGPVTHLPPFWLLGELCPVCGSPIVLRRLATARHRFAAITPATTTPEGR